MKAEIERIKKLMEHNWDGPMWHGGNLQYVLKDIDWQKAFRKPAAGSHNIYELVVHMHCWRKFVLEYLNGNNTYSVELNSETDWPTQYETSESSWTDAVKALDQSQQDLVKALDNASDEQLDEKVPGKKFTWYVLLHGMVHHDIYHSAQITILKK